MTVITGVRETRGLIEIYAEGSILVKLRKKHFDKRPLSIGDEIDENAYLDSIAALQFSEAYEAALSCLDFSERSSINVERALIRKGYVPKAAQAVVAKLAESGIIDDKRLAGRIAENAAGKPMGIYAVKRKLMSKGVSYEDAQEALDIFDGDQQIAAAKQARDKLAGKYAKLPAREARAKLAQALARRGFGWETVSSVLDDIDD